MSGLKVKDICTTPACALSLWQVAKCRLHSTTAEYTRTFYRPQPKSSMYFLCPAPPLQVTKCIQLPPWQLVWSNTRGSCVAFTCPSSGSLSAVFVPAAVYVGTYPQRDAASRYILLHSTHRSTVLRCAALLVRYQSAVKITSLQIRSTGSITWLT